MWAEPGEKNSKNLGENSTQQVTSTTIQLNSVREAIYTQTLQTTLLGTHSLYKGMLCFFYETGVSFLNVPG